MSLTSVESDILCCSTLVRVGSGGQAVCRYDTIVEDETILVTGRRGLWNGGVGGPGSRRRASHRFGRSPPLAAPSGAAASAQAGTGTDFRALATVRIAGGRQCAHA